MNNISANIDNIFLDINQIIEEYSVNQNITLIAVSKKKPADLIEKAYKNGILDFGENYLQEALAKVSILKHLNISWHFIGKIQSNKCKEIAKNFNWVHTVDRYKIAKLLSENCPLNKSINVLIQVNIDDEKSKNTKDLKLTEISFAKTKQIAVELNKSFKGVSEISMGMSNDFELAIKNGSTMIRIGTGIFGERN